MTTLQTGTKVLIEATVEATKDNDVHAVTKSAYVIRVDKSDLTVCETAQQWQPKDNEMIRCKKNCFDDRGNLLHKEGKHYEWLSGSVLSEIDTIHTMNAKYLNEYFEPVSSGTPSFKVGQEGWKPEDSCEWNMPQPNRNNIIKGNGIIQAICGGMAWVNDQEGDFHTIPLEELRRPIPAQPTVEMELTNWAKKHFSDVTIGDRVAELNNIFNRHQKHSGRVEVSVPSDEEIIDVYDNLAVMPHLTIDQAVIATVRHFMTRKEQQG